MEQFFFISFFHYLKLKFWYCHFFFFLIQLRNNILSCKIFESWESISHISIFHSRNKLHYCTVVTLLLWRFLRCDLVTIFNLIDKMLLTCVSVSINEVATSNLFGLLRYLFCLNCFSNSSNCCDVKAVLGLLVFPRRACWAAQPADNNCTL